MTHEKKGKTSKFKMTFLNFVLNVQVAAQTQVAKWRLHSRKRLRSQLFFCSKLVYLNSIRLTLIPIRTNPPKNGLVRYDQSGKRNT